MKESSAQNILKGLGIVFGLILLWMPLMLSAEISPEIFSGLKARSIGPANMSGRIGAIDAVVSNPNIIYVGGASGGVWKSTDEGMTWTPVFDDQPVASIGAIAINQSNPNVVWVGTGESKLRNSVSIGRGVYLTMDGGKTWKCLGLEKTEKISKILLHPDNPDIAYIGALGATWGDSSERGVYRTIDRGKTWTKILYVDEKTGVADMAMDPSNPNKIIVAMWEHRRWPWFFTSGGQGSGLYITTTAGENWQKLTEKNGLPAGDLGRCGIAFTPSRPEIVFALVEARKSILLRSTDGGFNWQVTNNESNIHNRPFYYSRIWVNPVHENTLYMLATQMTVSEDAGKTFRPLTTFGQSHSDYHTMWIHANGELMIAGNDGGVVISTNRGKNWRFVENLPLGQFYHVSFDMEIPYNVYGGLQDNGSWRGPAYVLRERGIFNHQWISVGGGDGFDTEPDPENPNCGYGMSQGGNLYYYDLTTGTSRSIVPTESEVKHRFNWNAGFALDSFQPSTIYLGSQFVHRSRDKGRTWEIISPDLTTNDPEKQKQPESGGLTLDVSNAENHCTILCIAPSPVQEGVIWIGTDDGNVQNTRDGGKTWELVSKGLTGGKKPAVPPGACVPHVEASKFDAATAYVVFDDHRRSNFTPYVFVTRDFGKTWKSLVTPEIDGYAFVMEEDTVNRNLLFLGTEFGLFVSFDGGGKWMKWTHGLPTVAVYDLAVHPRENDLIIATHGRSLYIIDDLSPLREISEELTQKKLHLFKVQEAFQFQQGRMNTYLSPGDTSFSGENKSTGACITYYLIPSERKPEPETPETQATARISITILDSQGKIVNQIRGTENKGINRIYWDFREQEPRIPGQAGEETQETARRFRFFRRRAGLTVLPGTYTVKIKYEDQEASQSFDVRSDPRLKVDPEVLKANYEMGKSAQQLSTAIQSAQRQIQGTQKSIQTVMENARNNRSPKMQDIIKAARSLEAKLKEFAEVLNPTPAKQGMADRSASLISQVMQAVFGIMGTGVEPVSQAAQVKYEKAKEKAGVFIDKLNIFYQTDVENFKKMLQEAGFSLFSPFTPLKL
ncbi:MAG: hypothetical protein WCC06_05400 [Candidatus Aminicenantales bacterium]